MQLARLNKIGAFFIKDKSLFINHKSNGTIDQYIAALSESIILLDAINDGGDFYQEIECEIVTGLIYLKEYENENQTSNTLQ